MRSGEVTEGTNERVENKRTEQRTGSVLTPGWLLVARITDALSRLINYHCDDGCDAVRKAQHPKNQQQLQPASLPPVITLLCLFKHVEIDYDAKSSNFEKICLWSSKCWLSKGKEA